MSRFSPEFAAKLRHRAQQVGSKKQFGDKRRSFGFWVAQCQNMMVINPFSAHYNEHMKMHYALSAQDFTTESYHAPESSLNFVPPPSLEPTLMEEDSPFRLPPGRHIIPIIYCHGRSLTLEEQAAIRMRTMIRLMNEDCIRIPEFGI